MNIHKEKLADRHYYFILGLIIVFVLLQVLFFLIRTNYFQDEEFSYLLAVGKWTQCNDILLSRHFPYGKLVDIQEYKNLLRVDDKFCFGKIRQDAATLDIHPPLYAWLLHIFILLTGGQATYVIGYVLNIFLGMLTILLFFYFGYELFGYFEDAFFGACLYAFNPVLYYANCARPYFLLTFIMIIAAYFLLQIIQKTRKISLLNIFLFSFILCLGCLTHYSFLYLCIGWSIFLIIHYVKDNQQVLVYYCISCLVGSLIFCIVFPNFVQNFINFNSLLQDTFRSNILKKIYDMPLDWKISEILVQKFSFIFSEHQKSLIAFLLMKGQIFYYICIVSLAILFLMNWFVIKRNKPIGFIFASFFYPFLFMAILFVKNKALSWTVYGQYSLFIFPFLILCIIFFLKKRLLLIKRIVLVCFCQILLFSTIDNLITKTEQAQKISERSLAFAGILEEKQVLQGKKYVILENAALTGNGIARIFKVIHLLPKETKIIIVDASFLLLHYSTYFGDSGSLFPFTYITFASCFATESSPSYILLKKFIDDNTIKVTPELIFTNLTENSNDIMFTIEKISEHDITNSFLKGISLK